MKQEKIEELVGKSYKHYSKLERGEADPHFTYLFDIAKALGTTFASIVAEVEKEYYERIVDDNDENK